MPTPTQPSVDSADRLRSLQLILDAGGYAYWEYNLQTGELIWDAQTLDLYGVSATEFTGRFDDWSKCVHPDDLPRTTAALEAAIASGDRFESEFRVVQAGAVRWVRALGVLRSQGADQRRFCGVNVDVTAEVERRNERALLATLAEKTADLVVVTDANERIAWVNEAFCRLTGYTSEECVGKRPADLVIGPDSNPETRHDIRRSIDAGRSIRRVVVNHDRHGDPYWLDLEILPVRDDRGEICNFISLGTDISAQRELEARLRAAAQMESLGKLAGAVAHDFNNLLTAVLGTADLLDRVNDDKRAVSDLAGDLRDVALAARELTTQLLSLSRSGAQVSNPIEVGAELVQMRGLLESMVGDQCELTIHSADDAWVRIPRGHFKQIVGNLVVNASQSMSGAGTVSVEIRRDDATQEVSVLVSDDGPGIPPTLLSTIFEPFVTTRGRESGTGLGLAIVRTLADRANGRVNVANRENGGASFTFTLPAIDAPAARTTGDVLPHTLHESVCNTILVVDDNPVVLRTLVYVCRSVAETVLAASGADEALQLLAEAPVDIMLTDVRMPGVSGTQLASIVRRGYPSVRTVLMTGYTDESLEEVVRVGDALDVLRKPFGLGDLRDCIAQLPITNGGLGTPRQNEEDRLDSESLSSRSSRSAAAAPGCGQ